jgi:hypothetical protein
MKDPKAWLAGRGAASQQAPAGTAGGGSAAAQQPAPSPSGSGAQQREKAQTVTMQRPLVFQNTLMAVAFAQQRSGFKDPGDAANRSNKHNGGDFLAFQS